MRTNDFLKKLEEALELEDIELTTDTNLKDLEEYDSLSRLLLRSSSY